MKQFFLSLLLLGVCMVSCTDRPSGSASAKRDEEIVMPILYQQRAAEYRALCFQAYNIARRKIDAAVANRKYKGKPFAIITDLDETALDNSASAAWLYAHDSAVNFAFLTDWWLKGIADSVPGSVSFFNYAFSQKIDIYYISNRSATDTVIRATMRNMNKLGFPLTADSDFKHFLFLAPGTPKNSKEPRRELVEAKDSVILLLGDNLIDLDAAFDSVSMNVRRQEVDRLNARWGDRYIVFPNSVYGDWENVLYFNYKQQYGAAPAPEDFRSKDSIRVSLLDTNEVLQ
jgi:5'-nucleotidase (lipoprotein e(P4) family)